jgi:hypothetical protein
MMKVDPTSSGVSLSIASLIHAASSIRYRTSVVSFESRILVRRILAYHAIITGEPAEMLRRKYWGQVYSHLDHDTLDLFEYSEMPQHSPSHSHYSDL